MADIDEQIQKLREHVPEDKTDEELRALIEEAGGDEVRFPFPSEMLFFRRQADVLVCSLPGRSPALALRLTPRANACVHSVVLLRPLFKAKLPSGGKHLRAPMKAAKKMPVNAYDATPRRSFFPYFNHCRMGYLCSHSGALEGVAFSTRQPFLSAFTVQACAFFELMKPARVPLFLQLIFCPSLPNLLPSRPSA